MLNLFVACPYSPPPLSGYRDVFRKIESVFAYVKFSFADERINSDVIITRIINHIRESSICLCDITGWNPNVTMELGLAIGMEKRVQLLFYQRRRFFGGNQMSGLDLPVDIRGHNRINYHDAASLHAGLRALVQQEVASPNPNIAMGSFKLLCENVYGLLGNEPGLKSFEIARHLGMETPDVRSAIDNLLREERIYQKGSYGNAVFYQKGYVPPAVTPTVADQTTEAGEDGRAATDRPEAS